MAPPTPELLRVEGGRGQFAVSPAVHERLLQWSSAVPTVVFGPDVAQQLDPVLGDNCLATLDAVPDPVTLTPGDVLTAEPGRVTLLRGGHTYRVGQTCDGGRNAGLSAKPWVATNASLQVWGGAYDAVNARCLAVALKGLLPQFVAADAAASCTVPQPPAGLTRR